jgi:lipid-A-disaccharide synthase
LHDSLKLLVVTGEASGDLIAADALTRLSKGVPNLSIAGIGGDRLRASGMDCWYSSQELAVRGYVEALSKLPRILSVRRQLIARAAEFKPQVFLGVDAPDFNLGVEAKVRSTSVRTVHLISPSIWAWRPERIRRIRQAVDHMLCVFPFEPEIYRGSGVTATYVGHPIADLIPVEPNQQAARAVLGLQSESRPVVAVLPGSRLGEIRHNGDAFLGAALFLSKYCKVIIPAASEPVAKMIRALAHFDSVAAKGVELLVEPPAGVSEESTAATSQLNSTIGAADLRPPLSHTVLAACDIALVASGTATLETALFKRPMVIGYRVPGFTYWLMKRKALIQDIGLPNILLGSRVAPEFIQDECTAPVLASEILKLLDQPQRMAEMTERFSELHRSLRQGAAQRISDCLLQELHHAHRGG